jgi:glycine/D-amino acid oxidase-like deaminating enzyme
MREVDYVIVGQGLAGTALAWQLRWRGCRVLVLDREPAVSSSRIAAGLITPVTGRRFAASWRFADLFPAAVAHYRRVECETGRACFRMRRCVRLLQDDAERALLGRKATDSLRGLVNELSEPLDPNWFDAPHGGFEMPAAQLTTIAYLDASRATFIRDSSYLTGDLDPARDVVPERNGVRLTNPAVIARAVVFCQGHAGAGNSWFQNVRFQSARGDILTLRIPGFREERIINRGVWLAPTDNGLYRAGSTFDRTTLLDKPTPDGREEIVRRLSNYFRPPFEVVEHQGAVRPIIDIKRPLLGRHPDYPGIAIFNGLGSKGSLVAPSFAAQLADALVLGKPFDAEALRHE